MSVVHLQPASDGEQSPCPESNRSPGAGELALYH